MALAYVPPGVTIQELTTPTIAPLLALPGSVCLVGMTTGYISAADVINLYGTTPTVLPSVPAGATMTSSSIVSVVDYLSPQLAPPPAGFPVTTAYTFNTSAYELTRVVTTGELTSTVDAGASTIVLTGSVPSVGEVMSLSDLEATFTGTLTINTNVISAVSSTSGLVRGQTILGSGVPGGTVITSIGATSLTVNTTFPASSSAVSLTAHNSELVTVASVASQTVTTTTPLVYNHSSTSPVCVVTWGEIPDGDAVIVQYTYVPQDYYKPIRLNSMTDIQTRFGSAWDPTNTIPNPLSPLSFAASMAFQNGASNVVLQPLYVGTVSTASQPTASEAANAATWANVYNGLLGLQDINLLVPVVGQCDSPEMTDVIEFQIQEATQDYLYQMNTINDIYVVAVVGEDSSQSASFAQDATLITHAQTLIPRYGGTVTQQMVFINTSQFSVANATSSTLVGGQYMAAAIAGMLSAQDPAATITRQAVAGFLAVTDDRTAQAQNNDAANGMLVVQSVGNIVQVRHAITMDATTVATRELSVVRAKFYIIESVDNTLNLQVIAQIVADANAPTLVNNVVIATLQELLGLGELVSYANVQSAITTYDPTTMAVSFDYQPSFYINYINISYSLDLTQNSSVTVTNAS